MRAASRGLGEYPVDGGDITDAGRRQQVAVAVWVLGFLWGPVPALAALVVTRPRAGPYRRLLVAAAWFWTSIVAGAAVIFVALRDVPGWLLAAWGTLGVVTLAVAALAIRWALRHIGSDIGSVDRDPREQAAEPAQPGQTRGGGG